MEQTLLALAQFRCVTCRVLTVLVMPWTVQFLGLSDSAINEIQLLLYNVVRCCCNPAYSECTARKHLPSGMLVDSVVQLLVLSLWCGSCLRHQIFSLIMQSLLGFLGKQNHISCLRKFAVFFSKKNSPCNCELHRFLPQC